MILKILLNKKIGYIPKYLSKIKIDNSNMSNSIHYKKIVIDERIKLLIYSIKKFNLRFTRINL